MDGQESYQKYPGLIRILGKGVRIELGTHVNAEGTTRITGPQGTPEITYCD